MCSRALHALHALYAHTPTHLLHAERAEGKPLTLLFFSESKGRYEHKNLPIVALPRYPFKFSKNVAFH